MKIYESSLAPIALSTFLMFYYGVLPAHVVDIHPRTPTELWQEIQEEKEKLEHQDYEALHNENAPIDQVLDALSRMS